MGTLDIPPPHVPSHTIPISSIFLQIGGSLWTICYILYVRESFRSKSYGMPLFALALNFGWEIVYGFIAEYPIERVVFFAWLLVDCGIVYGMLRFAKFEWEHAPVVKRNIGWFFALMAVGAVVGHGAFASWWIENEIGKQEGKFYKGVVGPDISELGYWSAVLCQLNLSAASLCQLVIRQHSGGVSWGIWASRTFGSIIGLYLVYGWSWYFWREAHGYFMSPFSVFLWGTSLIIDCVYPFVLWRIKNTEIVLKDGRKMAGVAGGNLEKKVL